MLINGTKYLIIFVISVLLQVLIFNNIVIAKMIVPYFYILFLILLPFQTPRALLLVLGFLLGLSIDAFTNTIGVHAFACVLIAFMRPGILSLISSRETIESVAAPRIQTMSIGWFIGYAAFMIIIHHLTLFFLEAFTFNDYLFTILRVLLSSLLSLSLIVLSQFLIFRK
jgi:rod shape-determining protein MreD